MPTCKKLPQYTTHRGLKYPKNPRTTSKCVYCKKPTEKNLLALCRECEQIHYPNYQQSALA